jgi:hypothetical protein
MSLEILKPPTDTLYKFLAVLGLVFFIASLVAPTYLAKQVNEQEIDLLKDLDVLLIEAKEWQEALKETARLGSKNREAHKELDETIHNFIIGKVHEADVKRALDLTSAIDTEYDTKIDAVRKTLVEWQKQYANIDYKKRIVENSDYAARRLVNISTFGLVAGLLMSITGFSLWYRRAQRYEDLVLKKKTEEPSRIIQIK